MDRPRCPGQDTRYWKPEDIFEVECPSCGVDVEIWKDEPFGRCSACKGEVRNPRFDFGCAEWCDSAEECLGPDPAGPGRESQRRPSTSRR